MNRVMDAALVADDGAFDSLAPCVRPEAHVRHFDNECVAWAPEATTPVHLDPVATIVYQLLDGHVSIADLVSDVHHALGIPEGVARGQLRRVVQLLHSAALLTDSPISAHLPPNKLDVFSGPPNN